MLRWAEVTINRVMNVTLRLISTRSLHQKSAIFMRIIFR